MASNRDRAQDIMLTFEARRRGTIEAQIVRNYREIGREISNLIAEAGKQFADGNGQLLLPMMEQVSITGSRELQRKISRLQYLEYQIDRRAIQIMAQNDHFMLRSVETLVQDGYYQQAWALSQQAGFDFAWGPVSFDAVEQVVKYPLSTLADSTVMSTKRAAAINRINAALRQGIAQGQGYVKISRRVDQALGFRGVDGTIIANKKGELYKSLRIVQTEGTRAYNGGREVTWIRTRDVGARGTKVWMATLDGRTRDRHGYLDGQKANKDGLFEVDGFKARYPGDFGSAALDINCRCTFRIEIDGYAPDLRRNREEGIREYETYQQWMKRNDYNIQNRPKQLSLIP
jgi:hypothetical protein